MGGFLDCHGNPDKKNDGETSWVLVFRGQGAIGRTRATRTGAFDDVLVDPGGGDVGMAEKAWTIRMSVPLWRRQVHQFLNPVENGLANNRGSLVGFAGPTAHPISALGSAQGHAPS